MRDLTSDQLFANVIWCWQAKFDTAQIAERFNVPEHVVARWVANYREKNRRASVVDAVIQAGAYDA